MMEIFKKPCQVWLLFILLAQSSYAQQSLEFSSLDGLLLSADLYQVNNQRANIVLFHQAGSSRGEFLETALWFQSAGLNVIAVDLRSGASFNNVRNKTHTRALERGLATSYIATLPDIEASLKFVRQSFNGKIIALGSSYSAGLVLVIAKQYPQLVDLVIAFSPGEYYSSKGFKWLRRSIAALVQPAFITGMRSEMKTISTIYNATGPNSKSILFTPEARGLHGAAALTNKNANNYEYRRAVLQFINANL